MLRKEHKLYRSRNQMSASNVRAFPYHSLSSLVPLLVIWTATGNLVNAAPDSKVHGAYMGPTWVLSAPDGPHVGPMNLAIRGYPHECEPINTGHAYNKQKRLAAFGRKL